MSFAQLLRRIEPLDSDAMTAAAARLDTLTKPPGSLGRLEPLVVQLAGITRRPIPAIDPPAVLVFAGDHGVTAEGVSAYPADVTPQMVLNFLAGGAAINALARNAGAAVRVIDVGVAAAVSHPDLLVRKVRPGTANMAVGPAMSRSECAQAIAVGADIAMAEIRSGVRCLALGEMGIGNTTPSAALLSVFGGRSPAEACGRGTGLDEAGVRRKIQVVEKAIEVNRPDPADPVGVLAAVGGLEIAALTGAILAAAAERVPVIIDGFIVGAAALAACRLQPQARGYLIASHRSAEQAHHLLLKELELQPLMDLELRLGEGSGAALALPLVRGACRFMAEMATFSQAGVSEALPE